MHPGRRWKPETPLARQILNWDVSIRRLTNSPFRVLLDAIGYDDLSPGMFSTRSGGLIPEFSLARFAALPAFGARRWLFVIEPVGGDR
jgi:hypothetical protein